MSWLDKTIETCSKLGRAIFGDFWLPIIRDTAQDAIGAYLVLSIGGAAGRLIAGKDFSSFAVCLKEWQVDPTGVSPYVCYGMVVLDFALWGAVLARLLYRALLQLTPASTRQYLKTRWKKLLGTHKPQLTPGSIQRGRGEQSQPTPNSIQPGGGQRGPQR